MSALWPSLLRQLIDTLAPQMLKERDKPSQVLLDDLDLLEEELDSTMMGIRR
jgi:hypothetical protein